MPHFKAHSSLEWFYEIEGEGEPLLFFHGWGVDRRIWRQQLKHFVEGYKVLSLDLPGHGKSSWEDISFEQMIDDIKEILDCEGISKVMTVGSSLGGLFALKLYMRHPDLIKKMSFVGSMPKFSKSEDYPYGLDIPEMKKLGDQLDNAYPQIIDIFFRSLFTKEERQSRRYKWLQKFRRYENKPGQDPLKKYLNLLEQQDLRDELSKVKVPMQFINGAQDTICSLETVHFLKELTHDETRFDIFHKCGHFPFLSRPYEFNDILDAFLKQA